MSEILPEESESQEIGHRAEQAFMAQMPASWRLQDLSGDSDAGIDAFIQVVVDARFSETFHTQFKGSTVSAYSADGAFVSVRLRVATINYYKRVAGSIMLVFADFSRGEKPATCPIYYLWIHEKLDEVLSDLPSDTTKDTTVTFRVPTANRLNDTLEVAAYLAAQREIRNRSENLAQAIQGVHAAPPAPVVLTQLTDNITLRGATYLESALSSTDTPWADPTPGTVAWSLKQLHERIVAGGVEDANELLTRINPADLRDAPEQAELSFLRGSLARLSGDLQETAIRLTEAHRLAPGNARYFNAWVEERLVRALPSKETVTALLEEIDNSTLQTDHRVRALRARILTVLERFAEAHAELDQLAPRHAAIERVVAYMSERRFADAIRAAQASVGLDVNRQTLLILRVLSARARFEQVFALEPGQESPPTGPPGLDAAQLVSLWNEVRTLAGDLANSGWPLNSELLLDVLAAISIAAGKAGEGLSLLNDFLQARPYRRELQSHRLKLAVFAGNFPVALDAAHQLAGERGRLIHLVLVHYQAGQFDRCAALIPALIQLPFEPDELLPAALAVAAHAARRMFDIVAERQCLAKLAEGGFSDRIAVIDLVSAAGSDKEAKAAARRAMIDAYRKNSSSVVLQDHLISALQPDVADDTHLILELSGAIRRRRQLRVQEVITLANALSASNRSRDAITALEDARVRLPDDPELISSEALLLERWGDASRARELLSSLLDSPDASDLARSIYINIAVRSGLLDEAVTQLQSALSKADTRDKKKRALHGLISVELFRDTRSPRLQPLIRQLGELVDPASEAEEGLYLQTVMISGVVDQPARGEEEISKIQRRIAAYIARFPESRYLSAISLPTEGGIQALEHALKKRFGRALEGGEELKRLRQQLGRGLAVVPYSWRPRLVVPNARTVPQLWEFTKRVGRGNMLLTFDIDHQYRALKDFRGVSRTPLIDLLSLLVVTDLGLWPTLLHLFDRIAISKATLLRIQYDDGPLSTPSPALVRLREAIRINFDKVEQPGELDDALLESLDGGLEETKALVATGRYAFYSDDLVSRVFVLGESDAELGLNTGQLIRNGERIGNLKPEDVGRKVAQLTRWNVGGVSFEGRHLLHCLPHEVNTAPTLKQKVAALHQDPDYQALVSGVWDPPKPYLQTVDHLVRLFSFLLRYNPDIDRAVLAAIWASWLDKVVLRSDIPFGIEAHLSAVLVRSAVVLEGTTFGAERLWKAYLDLIERHYGAKMNETVEKNAIRAVARMIASVAANDEGFRNRADDVMAAVRKGLTLGTAPDQCFMDAYGETRSAQAARGRIDRRT